MLFLEPANPAVVKRWRNFAFVQAGLSSAIGIASSVNRIIPAAALNNFPQHQAFIYAAFAIALISALLLTMVPKVITLSFAQVGGLTSLLYIGYSLAGVFIPINSLPVFYGIMILAIAIVVLLLSQSLWFFYQRRAYADFVLGLLITALAVFFCSYPLYLIATHALAA